MMLLRAVLEIVTVVHHHHRETERVQEVKEVVEVVVNRQQQEEAKVHQGTRGLHKAVIGEITRFREKVVWKMIGWIIWTQHL